MFSVFSGEGSGCMETPTLICLYILAMPSVWLSSLPSPLTRDGFPLRLSFISLDVLPVSVDRSVIK